MSRSYRAAAMGATAVVLHLAAMSSFASAQQSSPGGVNLPPVVVDQKKKAEAAAERKPPKAEAAGDKTATAKAKKKPVSKSEPAAATAAAAPAEPGAYDPGASTGGAGGTGGGRSDLHPGSPTNPFRLSQSSGNHTETITRKQIEQLRPRDVFDLVNNAASVIETQGSRKGFSGLLIRGDSNFIWILDGAYLQPTMASRIMRSIPVNIIEQVTVVRGAAALTLAPMVGSASPGGAPVDGFIVVRTRKPAGTEAEARGVVESHNTFQAGLWAGTRFKKDGVEGYVAGAISRTSTDGPGDLLDNGATYNKNSHTLSGLGKAGFSTGGLSLDLMAYQDDGRFGIPNANSHGPVGSGQGSWYMSPSRTLLAIASGSMRWTPEHTTLFMVSRVESEQTLWTANSPAGPYTGNDNPNYATHANVRHNFDLPSFRVSVGGDFRNWNAPNGQQYYEKIQREEETYGGFAEIEKRFFGDRLTVDAAVRFDKVQVLHGLDYYTGGAQPVGGVNSPLRTTNVSLPLAKFYELGTALKVTDEWKLTGRVGTSEQATSGLQARPGVTLSPDSQMKIEAGIDGRISRWFNPAVNFFHRAVENEKTLYGYSYLAFNNKPQTCRPGSIPPSGPLSVKSLTTAVTPCYDQKNTTREGVELTLSGQLWPGGSYKLNYTHFTNLENVETITPHNMAGLLLDQRVGPFLLTGAIKYVDAYRGTAADKDAWLGGYTRIDAGISREFKFANSSLTTTIYGRNLTDKHFETTNGIQDIGRVIGFEALAKF